MTVRELIEHLSQFPPEMQVVRTFCSDYDPVEAEQVTMIKATLRQGRYHNPFPDSWFPQGEDRVDIEVVHFAGN